MATPWRVDSIHLALRGQDGDSAIHLLVLEKPGAAAEVHWAMLIDGGRDGQDAVMDAIKDIQNQTALYSFALTGNVLKFDVVIVTHWDQDHWTGVLNAMRKDIQTQIDAAPTADPSTMEISFFKYTPGTGGGPRTPDTILYAPLYGWSTKLANPPKLTPQPKNAAEALLHLSWTSQTTKKVIKVSNVLKARIESDAKTIQSTQPTIVGTNVITGQGLQTPDPGGKTTMQLLESVKDPATLTTINKPAIAGQPGIYIIAASQHFLGPKPPGASPHGLGAGDEVGIVDKPEANNEKNESSIACMIIWPGTKPRLSHFFAGDLHYEQEARLVFWTGTNGNRAGGAGSWVTTVKASHHGAKTSTPVEMLSKFNPRNFVASVGEAFGHPSWQLLLYLEGWIRNEDLQKADYPPLLPTMYPYYLIKERDKTTKVDSWLQLPAKYPQISMEDIHATPGSTDPSGVYLEALENVFGVASTYMKALDGSVLVNPKQEWDNLVDPHEDDIDWVRGHIERQWKFLSPIGPWAHPAVSAGRTAVNHELIQKSEELSWIRIESRDSDDKDGYVYWRKHGQAETQHYPNPTSVPPTHGPPGGMSMPSGTALGPKRPAVSTAGAPSPPKKLKTDGAPVLGAGSTYDVPTGTNPDELDASSLDPESDVDKGKGAVLPLASGRSSKDAVVDVPTANEPQLNVLTAPYFFIASSAVQYDPPSPLPQFVQQLSSADPLDSFLSGIHLQGIILPTQPSTTSTEFHSQDEVQQWMSVALNVAESPLPLQMSVTADATGKISEFGLNVPALGCSFSTDQAGPILGTQAAANLGPVGTVPVQNSMILGLQLADKMTGLTLHDILQPATARGATLKYFDLLSLVLGNSVTFNVDKSPGSRSAVWFEPGAAYSTVVRMQYSVATDSLEGINKWIGGFLEDFKVDSITAITKLGSKWVTTKAGDGATNNWEFILTTTCTLTNVDVQPTVTFDFTSGSLKLTLQFDYEETVGAGFLTQIIGWIGKQTNMSGNEFSFQEWFENAGKNFDPPLFRRMELVIDLDPTTGVPTGKVEKVRIDLELGVNFGRSDDGTQEKVVFLFTYTWTKNDGSSLEGSLWCPPPPEGLVDRQLLASYEPHLQFEPSSITVGSPWATSLNLVNLIPSEPGSSSPSDKIINIPDGIPTDVTLAVIKLDKKAISFSAAIVCDEPESKNIPKLYLSRIKLDASYTFAQGKIPGFFDLEFAMGAQMRPLDGSKVSPIELKGVVKYNGGAGQDKGWSVSAGVETPGMYGAHFNDYFDTDGATSEAATALIQHLTLNYLQLDYTYAKGQGEKNAAQSFDFSGSMSIGKLELDLKFHYDGDGWKFTADAGAAGEPTSIQDILDSIVADRTVELPSCVGDILVGPPKQPSKSEAVSASEGDPPPPREFFNLTVEKVKIDKKVAGGSGEGEDGDTPAQAVVVTISVNVGGVAFTFLQYRNTAWSVKTTPSKRFLRIEINKIPDISIDIPLIGEISPPFDEMYFMWVQDGSKTTASGTPGFTQAEINLLNAGVLKDDPIFYKLTKDAKDYTDDDVLTEAGCHFVLVLKDKDDKPNVVMDYVFGKPAPEKSVPPPATALQNHARVMKRDGHGTIIRSRKPSQDSTAPESTGSPEPVQPEEEDNAEPPPDNNPADAGSGTQKTALKKSIGPFSISNVGLQFSNSTLSISLDASVLIGPIGMAMQGFSIDLDFKGKDILKNFPDTTFSLEGLTVSFDRAPLTIAGGLIHEKLDGGDYYAGGVDIGFKEWEFIAAGGYGELTNQTTQKKFTTTFVFAQLDGPLITLEFAIISGITGGFGYNNSLTLPTIAEVPTFPFLHMPDTKGDSGNSTLDTLMALIKSKWFSPMDGSFWVGAGLTVTAFQMLAISAVLVVEWDPEVKLGIYAVAVADVPSSEAEFKIAHVELGILASIDFGKGVAQFEAQLAPSSFILDPMCHLSGGFALYYWFKDGPQQTKGDWVFTLGGYNQAFSPPVQYPNPPRLQITWSLGPLSITGQAYFAITPKVCMAGGSLHASLKAGVLEAFFDAFADFLINYHPFSFLAKGGVSVGVRFTLDLWFVTIHISIEIGATLTIEGPPIFGFVHVNFWVFGFDIHFGPDANPNTKAATLEQFCDLVLQKGSPTAVQGAAPVPHLFVCQSGLLPSTPPPTQKMKSPRAPTPKITEVDEEEEEAQPLRATVDDDDDTSIWWVKAGTFTFAINTIFAISSIIVYPDRAHPITQDAPSNTVPIYSRPMHLTTAMTSLLKVDVEIKTTEPKEDYEPQWELRPIVSAVPKALWDIYNAAEDPNTNSRALLDPTAPTVSLMTGVLLVPPPPTLSQDKIAVFDAIKSQLQDVFPKPKDFPDHTTVEHGEWLPIPPVDPPTAQDWKNVQTVWDTPLMGKGMAAEVVNEWVAAMGWASGSLDGSVPERLVNRLGDFYVEAPLLGVVAAA